MKSMSIKAKLLLILTVFVVVSTGAVLYSLLNISSQRSDALIINLAGRQRALSQSLSKSVLGLRGSQALKEGLERQKKIESYRADILEKKKLFNDTLMALMNGGSQTDSDGRQIRIPKTTDAAIAAKLTGSKALWDSFAGELDFIIANFENPEKEAAVLASVGYIEENNVPLFKDMNKLTVMYQGASDRKLEWFKNFLYLSIVLNLATFAASIWVGHRLIIARLSSLHRHMKDITTGEGDLTKRVSVGSNDEIDVLGAEFNTLLSGFEVIISKLMGSTSLLKDSSERLSTTFSAMVEGINAQDQKSGQVATAMEEMSATVVEVARSASSMAEVAKNVDKAVQSGEESVAKVIERMNGIASSTKKSVEVVGALGSESQKIGNIIQVINDIADQTNLLALNAAIEAARAGDQGRGFAVVADEVRKLAERTQRATKEIDEMIKSIQEESLNAVESIELESAAVSEGVVLTKEMGKALSEITQSIKNVTDMVQHIATSTEQQSAVASSISSDMEAVASISKDSADGVNGVSALASGLSSLAYELENGLSKFKVSGSRQASQDSGAADEKDVMPLRRGLSVANA